MQNALSQYISDLDRLYQTGNATEHTYRPALQRLTFDEIQHYQKIVAVLKETGTLMSEVDNELHRQ